MELILSLSALVIIVFLALLSKGDKKQNKKYNDFPFVPRGNLLTKAEHTFFLSLKPIAEELDLHVSMKVRLWDLITVRSGTNGYKTYQNKISSKHLDFVLVDFDMKPVLVIELDDKSHDRRDRQQSDSFKNKSLEAAGIKILRVKCAGTYDKHTIKESILKHLK